VGAGLVVVAIIVALTVLEPERRRPEEGFGAETERAGCETADCEAA
jgi:hypothetical protein